MLTPSRQRRGVCGGRLAPASERRPSDYYVVVIRILAIMIIITIIVIALIIPVLRSSNL